MRARGRNTWTRNRQKRRRPWRARANKMKQKQEYLDRKQESGEDTREYYADKEEL